MLMDNGTSTLLLRFYRYTVADKKVGVAPHDMQPNSLFALVHTTIRRCSLSRTLHLYIIEPHDEQILLILRLIFFNHS